MVRNGVPSFSAAGWLPSNIHQPVFGLHSKFDFILSVNYEKQSSALKQTVVLKSPVYTLRAIVEPTKTKKSAHHFIVAL